MTDEKVSRIGVSLPPGLLKDFDRMAERMGYASRSDALRDAARYFMDRNQPLKGKGMSIGVISVVYDHDVKGAGDLLTELQHEYHDIIRSSTHLHLDRRLCLEIVISCGEASRISEIRDRLTSVNGVRRAEIIIAPAGSYEE
jgi:CopG family transcriptional regulator, nickel-responsive regulator